MALGAKKLLLETSFLFFLSKTNLVSGKLLSLSACEKSTG